MFDFRGFLKTLARATTTAGVLVAAQQLQGGAPITSGNVLVPAASAAGIAAIHAIVDVFLGQAAIPAQPPTPPAQP